MSAMVRTPSGVTSPLGVPRLNSPTMCPASAVAALPAPSPPPSELDASMTESSRSADDAGDLRGHLVAGDDQHRQIEGAAHVRPWPECVRAAARGGKPEPRLARRHLLGQRRLGGRPGRGQHLGSELVILGAAETDPEVRQVRVELEVAVPGTGRLGAGGGHALPGQRGDQVTSGRAQLRRADHLGDAHRLQLRAVRAWHPDARGRADPEPLVRGAVQRVPVLGDVDVDDAGRAADHRHGRLVHRQAAGHVRRERDAQQGVLADRAVNVGAELNPVGPVEQQRLLRDPQAAERQLGYQPAADRAALDPHGGGRGRGQLRRGTGWAEQPRALVPARVAGMLGLQHELVAAAARGQQIGPRPLVQNPAERAAAGRVGLDEQGIVLEGRRAAVHRPPAAVQLRARPGRTT